MVSQIESAPRITCTVKVNFVKLKCNLFNIIFEQLKILWVIIFYLFEMSFVVFSINWF